MQAKKNVRTFRVDSKYIWSEDKKIMNRRKIIDKKEFKLSHKTITQKLNTRNRLRSSIVINHLKAMSVYPIDSRF